MPPDEEAFDAAESNGGTCGNDLEHAYQYPECPTYILLAQNYDVRDAELFCVVSWEPMWQSIPVTRMWGRAAASR